jgi:hypothetical protein
MEPTRNAWVTEPGISIYVRKTRRLISGRIKSNVFDLANISVVDGKRGTGVLTAYLPIFEKKAKESGFSTIFVESIIEPRLCGFLEKHQYILNASTSCGPGQIDYYKDL